MLKDLKLWRYTCDFQHIQSVWYPTSSIITNYYLHSDLKLNNIFLPFLTRVFVAPLRIVHFFAPLPCPKCVLCAWWNCNSTTQWKGSKKCSLHREVTRAQRRSCLWEDVQCVHSTPSHCQTSGSPCRAALPRRCNEHDVPLVLQSIPAISCHNETTLLTISHHNMLYRSLQFVWQSIVSNLLLMSFTVTRVNGVASCNCQLGDISDVMVYASTTEEIKNFNDVTLASGLQALRQKLCLTLNLTLQHLALMKLTCFLSIPHLPDIQPAHRPSQLSKRRNSIASFTAKIKPLCITLRNKAIGRVSQDDATVRHIQQRTVGPAFPVSCSTKWPIVMRDGMACGFMICHGRSSSHGMAKEVFGCVW